MTNQLEDLGISILEPMLVEHFYTDQRAIFVHDLGKPDDRGLILDLDALPVKPPGIKEAVIRWLISVNLTRLRNGDEPIITLKLVLQCPVWKIVHPPLKRLTLTKEKLFNKPKVVTLGKKTSVGSINKKRS
jgi:hypothetical protein